MVLRRGGRENGAEDVTWTAVAYWAQSGKAKLCHKQRARAFILSIQVHDIFVCCQSHRKIAPPSVSECGMWFTSGRVVVVIPRLTVVDAKEFRADAAGALISGSKSLNHLWWMR